MAARLRGLGVEGHYSYVGDAHGGYRAESTGAPILARPLTDVLRTDDQIDLAIGEMVWPGAIPHPQPDMDGTSVWVQGQLGRRMAAVNVVAVRSVSDVNDDWPVGDFEDATEVRQLRSLAYTFLLPLEIWMLLIVVGIPILVGSTLVVRWIRSRRVSMVTEPMKD